MKRMSLHLAKPVAVPSVGMGRTGTPWSILASEALSCPLLHLNSGETAENQLGSVSPHSLGKLFSRHQCHPNMLTS